MKDTLENRPAGFQESRFRFFFLRIILPEWVIHLTVITTRCACLAGTYSGKGAGNGCERTTSTGTCVLPVQSFISGFSFSISKNSNKKEVENVIVGRNRKDGKEMAAVKSNLKPGPPPFPCPSFFLRFRLPQTYLVGVLQKQVKQKNRSQGKKKLSWNFYSRACVRVRACVACVACLPPAFLRPVASSMWVSSIRKKSNKTKLSVSITTKGCSNVVNVARRCNEGNLTGWKPRRFLSAQLAIALCRLRSGFASSTPRVTVTFFPFEFHRKNFF